MNNLYDALETCLEAIEQGMDIETTLARYPDIADELRPILQTSMVAREKAVSVPSGEMMRRNRAKLLQRAAVLRTASVRPAARDMWFASLRRLAVTVLVLAAVFGSGAGLVNASSTTLPGDNLYPLKRTWEDVALLFTFDLQRHASLEVEYENERLEELHELMAEGRSARVDFCGIVTQQNGNQWLVSGITIVVSAQTDFHDGPVFVGDAVDVFGIIQGDGSVLVERIDQLPPGAPLPDIGDSGKGSNSGSGSGHDDNDNDVVNENDSSGPGNGNDNSNSGPGGGNDNENNSGPGGDNDNGNDDPAGENNNENSNSSGSGGGINSGNDNSNDDNSGSGSGENNINEDSSGSGSGSSNSNEDNSGSGGGGEDDNGNEEDSNSNDGGD